MLQHHQLVDRTLGNVGFPRLGALVATLGEEAKEEGYNHYVGRHDVPVSP